MNKDADLSTPTTNHKRLLQKLFPININMRNPTPNLLIKKPLITYSLHRGARANERSWLRYKLFSEAAGSLMYYSRVSCYSDPGDAGSSINPSVWNWTHLHRSVT